MTAQTGGPRPADLDRERRIPAGGIKREPGEAIVEPLSQL